jgi:hypothetical protein
MAANHPSLSPLTVNGRFIDELLSAEAPCFALGLVEEKRRTRGFLALRLEEDIPAEVAAAGFGLGHQLLGDDDFEVARFSFDFYGFKTWHALVNPASPVVRRVLGIMVVSADYFIFTINAKGSATLFRSQLGTEDLAGLKVNLPRMQHSTTTDAQYDKALTAFTRKMGADTMLEWVCRSDANHLDLSRDRLVLNPS